MKIKSFAAEIFAGISNRNYQFDDGLNILLGNNEAGKSTVINAIYASLFVSPQIRLNTTEGKEFKERFFPYPDGDYAEAEVKFEVNNSDYKFYKKWSNNNYRGFLELSDGRRIENPAKITEYKKEIFPYGKSTYNNIVFSSQQDIKSTLKRINAEENPELIDTINSFLRRAVMELDGVSIDQFRSRIENELEALTKKWNLAADAVSNSDRGINNPYKVGSGEIYDCYIAKEKLRRKIKESKINERKFEELSAEIKKLKKEEAELIKKIRELSEIEAEINQRAAVELEAENIEEKIDKISKTAQKWPKFKAEMAKLKEKMNKAEAKLKKLEAEKKRAKKLQRRNEIKERVKQIKAADNKLQKLLKLNDEAKATPTQVEKMEAYKDKITETKASLKAAKLKAKLNFSASEKIRVLTGVEGEKSIAEGEIIEADGYLRIKTDQIDIEIESAEIDFVSLKEEYNLNQKKFEQLKSKMEVESLEQAREKLNKITEIKREIEAKKNKIDELLARDKLKALENELTELEQVEAARDIENLNPEIEDLKAKISELNTEIKIKENRINEWQEEYQSLTELESILAENKERKEELKVKLNELASLPAQYSSSSEFINDLKTKREKREELNQILRDKLEQHQELENLLPTASTREMESELKDLQNKFESLKNKAKNLLEIKKVFERKLEEMDQNSFKPLINSFSRNLQHLTAGKYETGEIDADFSVKLKSKQKQELPGKLELLSYGTYDAAALALRFAIFDNLFSNYGGFIILDDCLVNFDPERRKKAIELIKEYQKKYQIIYTTCDPERAAEFEANVIQI
ncbi:exonuclease SbcC [Halanaerobium saccharolyticum]|uniref:Nuclease SbcCD subunit C n=1 Tax=Halanaerobium saccharolyticum TaxID=43595 RepID=A0A4R7YV40_9FIRM|nr:AAA family ATPase [Halanaerobium saccharolyticum]RAK05047.1 exonuclease SbcC [Halanaerobium saccharolyticum]TDV98833.1 exonuclease SbcC [Halanaerobium saccharolyticum]TDX51484.1 exonuclease SbcC [Halanaerobium saccharolyticum]